MGKNEKEEAKRSEEERAAGLRGNLANIYSAKVSSRKEKRIKWEL
ncbi:Uncharacterised protein [Candidatus Gugararchaeum adminiculabundum]|nr:Uncharacterised protein [Candidatus Gugararchaeum adminiculabundum]